MRPGLWACHQLDFHVGPVFPAEPGKPGHHLYLIEFADTGQI